MEKNNYSLPELKRWQGRLDTPDSACFFQNTRLLNLLKEPPNTSKKLTFALLGFCCDEGIRRNQGRVGAAQGPDAIREVLAKLPMQRKNINFYDAGNIICVNADLEGAQQALGDAVAMLLQYDMTPIVLGGGHELAWGHYLGIAKKFPQENLGILNMDAHFDMRALINNRGSSGTPFLQIAEAHKKANRRLDYNCIGIQNASNIRSLFTTANSYHTQFILADELHAGNLDSCFELIERLIDQNEIIYLSLCLDVFAAAYAPGVSAPQPLGVTPWQIIPFMRRLAASGKIISYDIAELSPKYDSDQRTTKLAANLIYEIIHHHKNFFA